MSDQSLKGANADIDQVAVTNRVYEYIPSVASAANQVRLDVLRVEIW